MTRTQAEIGAEIMASPVFDRLAEKCSYAYQREHLARLGLILWDAELEDFSVEGTEFVISKVAARLKTVRAIGLYRHWSYDLNRHIGLKSAWFAERRRLAELVSARNGKGLADLIERNLVEKMGAETLEAAE